MRFAMDRMNQKLVIENGRIAMTTTRMVISGPSGCWDERTTTAERALTAAETTQFEDLVRAAVKLTRSTNRNLVTRGMTCDYTPASYTFDDGDYEAVFHSACMTDRFDPALQAVIDLAKELSRSLDGQDLGL